MLKSVLSKRNVHIELLWNMTSALNVLHRDNWTRSAVDILNSYTRAVYDANDVSGWNVDRENSDPEQWSYVGSLLFSITVITTIGRSPIFCKLFILVPVR